MDQSEIDKPIRKEGEMKKEKLSGELAPTPKKETEKVFELHDPGKYYLKED